MHLFTSAFQILTEIGTGVHIAAVALASFVALSVIWKGSVPLIICILGVVLIQYSVMLTYYPVAEPAAGMNPGGTKFTYPFFTPTAGTASNMHFLLGTSMLSLSMIIAYRPSVLFARNRPESLDAEWSKYPMWQDNALVADGHTERSVPVKSLMNDQDRYLLWRYEYVLASIYGTPHLVKPNGLVPIDSTNILRDGESGRVIGRARYTGFFM